jgi:hypothetical protein
MGVYLVPRVRYYELTVFLFWNTYNVYVEMISVLPPTDDEVIAFAYSNNLFINENDRLYVTWVEEIDRSYYLDQTNELQ